MTANNEERYRALSERAPVGILYADQRSTYLDANHCICTMLGYARDELIGMDATEIVAPEQSRHIESGCQPSTQRAATTANGDCDARTAPLFLPTWS